MLKFLHTADWHLGAHQHPTIYKEQMLPKLVHLAEKHNVKYIICAGDIFDRPNPTQQVKDQLLKMLVSNPELTFIFTVGNHDYTTKSHEYHSLIYLDILRELMDNVYVYHEGIHNIDSVFDIGALPEGQRLGSNGRRANVPLILISHTPEFYNIQKGIVKNNSIDDLLKTYNAQYLALGDIHKHVQLHERCWYPGSLVQKTFGCEDGVVLVELDKETIKTTSLRLDLPKKLTLPLVFKDDLLSEQEIINFIQCDSSLQGQFVKLQFKLPMDIWATLNKERIKRDLSTHILDLTLENHPVVDKRNRVGIEKVASAQTVEQELEVLIQEETLEIDKHRLTSTCKKYINA